MDLKTFQRSADMENERDRCVRTSMARQIASPGHEMNTNEKNQRIPHVCCCLVAPRIAFVLITVFFCLCNYYSSVFNKRNRPAASRIRLNSIQNACTSIIKSCFPKAAAAVFVSWVQPTSNSALLAFVPGR